MAEFALGKYLKGSARRYRGCLEACVDCSVLCRACIEVSLEREAMDTRPQFIRACLDCAAACVACVIIIPYEPERARELCLACAELSDRCAEECEAFREEYFRQCEETCRRCAAWCRRAAAA